MKLIISIITVYLLATSTFAGSSNNMLFHEDWSGYSDNFGNPVELGTGPTKDVWINDIPFNNAWILALDQTQELQNGYQQAKATPESWDAPGIVCLSNKEPSYSLWLPFGSHGMNRIRHNFSEPYPKAGTLSVLIWIKNPINMRQRGISLVLGTPSGKDAVISFGMWAGTDSPSYRIQGIRTGVFGYDDNLYHRLNEISMKDCGGVWNELIISIGRSAPDRLTFQYRKHGVTDIKYQEMVKPLELQQKQDYTCIKALTIGSMAPSFYAGINELFDNAVFVANVSFVN